MFSHEERERAVELYFTTPMSTKQVVEHLGIRPGSVWSGGCMTIPGTRMPSPSRPYRWRLGAARWNCACRA